MSHSLSVYESDKTRLTYRASGAELPVIFLHPTPLHHEFWSPVVERVIWPFDADGDGQAIVAVFNDPGGSGVKNVGVTALMDFIVSGCPSPADRAPIKVTGVADGTSAHALETV